MFKPQRWKGLRRLTRAAGMLALRVCRVAVVASTALLVMSPGGVEVKELAASSLAMALGGPKGEACRLVGCPDRGELECAKTTIMVDTPYGSLEAAITCYQDPDGTEDPQ